MTENNKPEWFEIAEKDGPAKPLKASKTLPLTAVFATALILGVGAIVSQIQEEPPATATETTAEQLSPANASASPSSDAPIANPSMNSTAATQSSLVNPSIAQLPTNGEENDDDYEQEGRTRHGHHDDDEGDDDEGDDD